jgi:hypothetical protein
MTKRIATVCAALVLVTSTMTAGDGDDEKGGNGKKNGHDRFPRLDHVFVIMMENHSYSQILDNPNAPFANAYASKANKAANYFAVAHPSLTNYLEVVGGSNFGVHSDNNPDWHNGACVTNLMSGVTVTDVPASPAVCPIWGTGMDAATPLVDATPNELSGNETSLTNIDGVHPDIPPAFTHGKTIADQLVDAGMRWKSYQESLPAGGADGVNFSDGFFTDSSDITGVLPGEKQGLLKLYAAKHNPFVYFRNVQEGQDPHNSLKNVVGFEGARGLFDDLESGHVPDFSFIVPNQCNDQHGRANGGSQCDFDPNDDGTQNHLNPALIYLGDKTLETLVRAIHASPAWHEGRTAIVTLWDENDYSNTPITNQVLVIVDTNYGVRGVTSGQFYTHFSLLRTLEAAFGLPCLNHACDANATVMADLFREK